MFFRRGVSEDDGWLQVKIWLFSIGAGLALAGMLLEGQWLMGGAALVLLAGFLLRFVPNRTEAEAGEIDDGSTDAVGAGGTGGEDEPW